MLNRWDVSIISVSFPELRSSISLRRIKHLFTASFIPLILLVPSAHAASFDCAKATTEVEKVICSDPEISELDEELSIAYNNALKYAKNSELIRNSQREWLKDRNACSDISCIKKAYEKRLTALSKGKLVVAQKYPPYPDVWDWEYPIESTETNPALPLRLFMLSNGDVLVSKENKLLFGGQSTSYIPDAFFPLDVTRNRGVVHLNDGTQVSGVKASGDRIKLSNGVEVDSNDNTRLHCYHGPIRNSFHTYDEKKGGYGPNKVIFTILDKPKHYMWDQPRPLPGSDVEVDPCNEEGPPGYTTRVDVVWGGDMLALDDGTFLLPMGNGLIVRFDEHFNTKSPLLNRRFFVFDISFDSNSGRVLSGDIETARVLFIDTINGKKYDLSKTGYQPVYDDLYKHLDNIRRNQP